MAEFRCTPRHRRIWQTFLAKNQAAADRAFKPTLHPIAPQRSHFNQIFTVNPQNLDRPIAVEIDRRPYSSSNFPRACKNVNLHPPFHIPCVILIIVTTGMTLRTQVLSVTLAMASAQIITLNLVFR
ncbi:hypothetical protein [Microcoleus sp.]|uniref:hypothetical protein n=1 Tax=Microcoleus sp. TaxID=44472 RepID=UPI00403E3700